MKLKLVERTTERSYGTTAKVSVNAKGTFHVNKLAMKLLDVTKPKKLQIFQDEIDQQKWFIHFNEKGYCTISPKSDKDTAGQFNAADLAKAIVNSYYHIGKKSLQFKLLDAITYQGEKYYPLEVIRDSLEMEIPNPNGPAKSRDSL